MGKVPSALPSKIKRRSSWKKFRIQRSYNFVVSKRYLRMSNLKPFIMTTLKKNLEFDASSLKPYRDSKSVGGINLPIGRQIFIEGEDTETPMTWGKNDCTGIILDNGYIMPFPQFQSFVIAREGILHNVKTPMECVLVDEDVTVDAYFTAYFKKNGKHVLPESVTARSRTPRGIKISEVSDTMRDILMEAKVLDMFGRKGATFEIAYKGVDVVPCVFKKTNGEDVSYRKWITHIVEPFIVAEESSTEGDTDNKTE